MVDKEKTLLELYNDFLGVNTGACERMLAGWFDQTKKAHEFWSITDGPQTVEEYKTWLIDRYPVPIPDWFDGLDSQLRS